MSLLPAITTTASAVTGEMFTLDFPNAFGYVHVETDVETLRRRSDEYADAAMAWILRGRHITGVMCAELAECYAFMANRMEEAIGFRNYIADVPIFMPAPE